jgi:hypothetical protein
MDIFYSDMEIPEEPMKGIFLAGPTPRDNSIESWRVDALKCLSSLCYNGAVYIPERSSGWAGVDYDEQVEWEHSALEKCDAIVFWIPRKVDGGMPAFTTNVEFGIYFDKEKTFYGRPHDSDKNRYLDHIYGKAHPDRKIGESLDVTLGMAAVYADKMDRYRRHAGETHCCTTMGYAVDNGVIDYVIKKYNFTYAITVGDNLCRVKFCPWCGVNIKQHKLDMMSGEIVNHAIHSRPARGVIIKT